MATPGAARDPLGRNTSSSPPDVRMVNDNELRASVISGLKRTYTKAMMQLPLLQARLQSLDNRDQATLEECKRLLYDLARIFPLSKNELTDQPELYKLLTLYAKVSAPISIAILGNYAQVESAPLVGYASAIVTLESHLDVLSSKYGCLIDEARRSYVKVNADNVSANINGDNINASVSRDNANAKTNTGNKNYSVTIIGLAAVGAAVGGIAWFATTIRSLEASLAKVDKMEASLFKLDTMEASIFKLDTGIKAILDRLAAGTGWFTGWFR